MYEQFFFTIFILSVLIFLTLIPIYLHTSFYYELGNKKTGFCVELYGKIRVFGGYITTCSGGIALHVNDQKAYVFSYRQMDDGRKSFTPQNGITFKKISVLLHCSPEYYVQLSLLENVIKTGALFFKKEDIQLQGKTLAIGENTIRIYGKIVVKIAIYAQILAFIRYLLGRIKAWREKVKN